MSGFNSTGSFGFSGGGSVICCGGGGGGCEIIVLGSGVCSSQRCGSNNNASGDYSTAFGRCNFASGEYSTASGYCNTASGSASTSFGIINSASGNYTFIGGGQHNCTFSTYAPNSFIGGGIFNCICSSDSVIVGGLFNTILQGGDGSGTFIGAGLCNTVSNYGNSNSFIGGGNNNTISAYAGFGSILVGGTSNTISGCYAQFSTLVGGYYNNLRNAAAFGALGSTIVGGVGHNTTGGSWGGSTWSVFPTGHSEIGKMAFIGGGLINTASGIYSAIVGGSCNTISNPNPNYNGSFIGGGKNNSVSGAYSSILGGRNNSVSTYNFSSVLYGFGNSVEGFNSTASGYYNATLSNYSSISGGSFNIISQTYFSSIVGGTFNLIRCCSNASFIGGGYYNNITNISCINNVGSVVVGGSGNNTCGGTWSGYYWGLAPTPLTDVGGLSFIGGGLQNHVSGCYGVIGGGCKNCVGTYSTYSNLYEIVGAAIIGGTCNKINGNTFSGYNVTGADVIGGGYCNVISAGTDAFNFIGGGLCNMISSDNSVIVGGSQNSSSGYFSVIVGGLFNLASGSFSSIGGGNTNIATGTNSFIGSGTFNCAIGCFSAVLGGALNCAANPFTGVFGCSVTNNCPCSFMSNNLRACNIFGSGAICANAGGTIVPVTSDIRQKDCVIPIDKGLDLVSSLNPVSFYWKEGSPKEQNGDKKQLGFVAQEIKQVVPEAVYMTYSGYYGFDVSKIVPILTKGVQELKSCNDSLKFELENLKTILKNNNLA